MIKSNNRKILCRAFCLAFAVLVAGCEQKAVLNSGEPVTITMWHNYGGILQETMDELVDEFNATRGREQGVIISVTAISASRELNEQLSKIAAGDPGVPKMPDLAAVYPAMAMVLSKAGLIAPLDDLFTEKELSAYLPRFVEEGRLPDGKLYVFPVAKSTEALFVNKTFFDRFAAASGMDETLATFEGLASAALRYYQWTDSQTPDIPGDGKAFFTADSWFNVAMAGMAQLGGDFAGTGRPDTGSDAYRRIWELCVPPALAGAYAVADNYSSSLCKTGEIVACTGSTAGILFYGDSVIYADNTSERVEYLVLPYPVFEGGARVAVQRGAGMAVAKSTPQKEAAAAIFLKWLTAPDQNMRFVASTGYLPVTHDAFGKKMTGEIEAAGNTAVGRLMEAAAQIYEQYDFIVAPNLDGIDRMTREYEAAIKRAMQEGRQRVAAGEDAARVSEELFAAFAL
ncbi:MAG: extracellular solute-binding protein [Spirochaetaceae bacterium]|jgi:multiple sugar transport system substrate-binding protein|nr:extracellular solute-binding protein [Spirochaetaceae bacterium]